jgi:uncharacterized protein YfcZ (UPF0381/DUF406 family)
VSHEKALELLEKISEVMNLGEELGVGTIITQDNCRAVLHKLFGEDAEDTYKLLTARAQTNAVQ